jgi:hypothetical protein
MDTPDTPSNVAPQAGARPAEGTAASGTKPNGPAVAVMLAAGIGAVVLGIFTTLSEASEGVHDFLEFSERVGPLSGKTDLAATAFLLSWAGLYAGLRERDLPWRPVIIATIVLFVIAVVMTYPPFFTSFASE